MWQPGSAVSRWPGPSRPRARHRHSDREPASAADDDAFVRPRRHAGGRDRRAESVCPGRPVAGTGMPDRPRQARAPAGAARRNAYPADFRAQPPQLRPERASRRTRPRKPGRLATGSRPLSEPGSHTPTRPRTAWLPPYYLAGPQNWLPTPGPGELGRQRCGQPGGQVSGEGGQIRVGPRRQRLAHPLVELVLGQHALNERGLEDADHLFAVGVRGAQVTAASRPSRDLISQPCHHGTSPSTMHESVACNHVWTFAVRPFRATWLPASATSPSVTSRARTVSDPNRRHSSCE